MESIIAEGEWISLSGMYTTEDADFMAQLLGTYPLPNELESGSRFGVLQTFWPGHESIMNMAGVEESSYFSLGVANSTSSFCFPQGSSSFSAGSSSILFPSSSSNESYYMSDSHPIFAANDGPMSLDFCIGDVTNNSSYLIEADHDCFNQEMSDGNAEEAAGKIQSEPDIPDKNLQAKRESEMSIPEPAKEHKTNNPFENSKKRSRSSGDVQKNKKNLKLKKNQKSVSTSNNDEDTNGGINRQSSSSCCSEDDINASQELNGGVMSSQGPGALNSNGKPRASRGAATDPQSLYARKRREMINERLRILQNLVPNGTKVDISTMLEEAVQYVKFLQLQIKLLSSDDLWMYAPIAYNGMDIGLDLKLTVPR